MTSFLAYALAFILLSLPTIDARSQGSNVSFPDRWAGKVVKDADHVDRMVFDRLQNAPKVGEKAPLTLVTEAHSGKPFLLSSFYRKKPTVVYFASYSCVCSQESAKDMVWLADKYKDQFHFILIYLREAHPTNGFSSKVNKYPILDANRFPERVKNALKFAKQSKITFPVLVDSIDDRHCVRWGAWPVRLFVVDQNGVITYAGQQGPWFVKPTQSFELVAKGIPEEWRNLPGYSRESLEEFLTAASKRN